MSVTGFRPTTLEYPTTASTPTSRELTYSYGTSGSSDDAINRLQAIEDGSETDGNLTVGGGLAMYAYLGVDTIATEDYPDRSPRLQRRNDSYSALDQFDRVVDQVGRATGRIVPRACLTGTNTATISRAT